MKCPATRRAWMQQALALSGLGAAAGLTATVAAAPQGSNTADAPPPTTRPAPPHDDDTPRPDRPVRFPRDFGAHPGTRIEWWYITGALRAVADAQAHFGFQITFFRSRTAQADRQPASASRLAPRHLLFAHAALTDVKASKLVHAERLMRWAGPPSEQVSTQDTRVHIGRWHLQRSGPVQASVYEGAWHDDDAGFGLQLSLQATQPVLLQGDGGYSRKSPRPGHASGYYSQPQLRTSGTLFHQGRRMEVEGTAWLDHEWSSALLDPEAVGWDWLGLNLDDGRALTVFRLRRADGSVLWAGGSLRLPGRAPRAFAPSEVEMKPGRTWRSAATDAVYPVEWTITTPAGTQLVKALVDAQELDNRNRTGTVYWEGLSVLNDPQGHRVGMGYLEMTGYAGRLQL